MAQDFKISVSQGAEQEELNRTLTTLFSTRAGSLPGDRDFGIAWDCLDEVPEVAESLFYLEALKKIERYEPRAEISKIVFEQGEGRLIPHIYVSRKADEA